jgi:serine/threonine protein kinase
VKALEEFHKTGYIHCDLKLDNIMISHEVPKIFDYERKTIFYTNLLTSQQNLQNRDIKFIDFGLVKKYKDSNGNHIK